ncbi:MAG: hypothetical protein TV41_03435 [Wolbachia endosymbiont of Dactylopius coccus]|nr:MAG: hypothetical protein TV41_03435 [Wolbachia endosymbiont of Dactylopius coccus]
MKKLLTLVICCSLSAPSFGVDWIKDRIYTSFSGGVGANVDLGYHYTDSIKISIGPVIKPILNEEVGIGGGFMAKLHYHYKFESTDITPYITAGVGAVLVYGIHFDEDESKKAGELLNKQNTIKEIRENWKGITGALGKAVKFKTNSTFFSFLVGFGANLPLSERTNVFAGYKLQKFHKLSHGVELGVSFNL